MSNRNLATLMSGGGEICFGPIEHTASSCHITIEICDEFRAFWERAATEGIFDNFFCICFIQNVKNSLLRRQKPYSIYYTSFPIFARK
jgi:hypothetical protein